MTFVAADAATYTCVRAWTHTRHDATVDAGRGTRSAPVNAMCASRENCAHFTANTIINPG